MTLLGNTRRRPIIAATDFSADAAKALRRGAQLASTYHTPLEALHVISSASLDALRDWVPLGVPELLVEEARHLVEQIAASAGVAATGRLAVGEIIAEILARCADASLLVLGMHGMNPLRDAILGTTAERLVGRCNAPVLIVRNETQGPYRHVLAAVDLLPGSQTVLECAKAFMPHASIAVAHAYDVLFESTLERAGVTKATIDRHRNEAALRARAAIQALSTATLGDAHVAVSIVERAHPVRLVVDTERAIGADLVVIGKRHRTPVEAFMLGSVTRHVLADAAADVLVVHVREDGQPVAQ